MSQSTPQDTHTSTRSTPPESPIDPQLRLLVRPPDGSDTQATSDTCSASENADRPVEIFQPRSSLRRKELRHRRDGIPDITKLFREGARIYDGAEEEEKQSQAYYEAHKSENGDWECVKSDEEVERERGIERCHRSEERSREEEEEEQEEGEISVLLVQDSNRQGTRTDKMTSEHGTTRTGYADSEGTVFEDG